MTIHIGLIGVGRMGQVFAHQLASAVPGVHLRAVADPNPEAANMVSARYGAEAAFTDYRHLLERKDIDAVVIATPTNTHSAVIQDAARAGKHIFTEKPLALNIPDSDAAIKAVKLAGVKLQVGFMRRYDRGYKAARQKIDQGLIGQPVMFKAVGRDPHAPRLEFARRENSGGLILDMAIHDFDAARWLMGAEVERVYSEGACLVFPELKGVDDIDNAVVSLKFTNGAVGAVDVSRNAVYGYDIFTEILGSQGSLVISQEQFTPLMVRTKSGVTHDTVPNFMERFGEAYAAEIADFAAALREDREPSVGAEDARMAVAIGVAATRSLDEGRPVLVSEVF